MACVILLSLCLPSAPAHASKASDNLVARGLVQLKGGKFVAATKYFNGAAQVAPKDPRALFFLGVSLNRLGQHGAALESFQRMWRLKVTHRELGLEGGWAAIAQGRTALAVSLLEPYVKANPDNAKAHEFLGRAYIGDGRLDDAERQLKRAVEIDPAVKPTSLYYLGNIAALRNDGDGVAQALNGILQEAPNTRTGSVLRNTLRRAAAAAPQKKRKPWFASVSVSGGRNSNVIGLPENAVLPTDVSSRDSKFTRTQADAGYSWRIDADSILTTGYGFTYERYSDVDGFNSTSHSVYADYRRKLNARIEAGLRVSPALSFTNGDTSVQRTTIAPFTSYRWSETDVTSLRYSLSPTNYTSDPARKVLDRDALNHVLTLSHSTRVDNKILPLGVNLQVGLTRVVNEAEGDDYDYASFGGFISASRKLPFDILGSISYSHQRDDYRDPNSLAGAGFAFQRQDRIDRLSLYFERSLSFIDPEVDHLSLFVNWQYLNNKSNLSFFNYQQKSLNIGVTARF
ncbi:MAG: Flp pilus assembly protein TadD [Paracoccaceae bacterium]